MSSNTTVGISLQNCRNEWKWFFAFQSWFGLSCWELIAALKPVGKLVNLSQLVKSKPWISFTRPVYHCACYFKLPQFKSVTRGNSLVMNPWGNHLFHIFFWVLVHLIPNWNSFSFQEYSLVYYLKFWAASTTYLKYVLQVGSGSSSNIK